MTLVDTKRPMGTRTHTTLDDDGMIVVKMSPQRMAFVARWLRERGVLPADRLMEVEKLYPEL
jgi:hypothetical protein